MEDVRARRYSVTRWWPLRIRSMAICAPRALCFLCAIALLAPLASCDVLGLTPLTTPPPPAQPNGTATPNGPVSTVVAMATAAAATQSSGPYAFPLIAPGGALPSESTCAARVRPSLWEPRPDNTTANQSVPTSAQLAGVAPWNKAIGMDPRADALRQQITGHYTGTTDEILQWVACKWGIPVDIVRAQAFIESSWHQNNPGDWTSDHAFCPPGTWTGSGCHSSYGILQVKWYYFHGTWPMIQTDTAFDAELVYGVFRACYEGLINYLYQEHPLPGYPSYHAGDLWGCIGEWYSGGWYNLRGEVNYIDSVKAGLAQQVWNQPGF